MICVARPSACMRLDIHTNYVFILRRHKKPMHVVFVSCQDLALLSKEVLAVMD